MSGDKDQRTNEFPALGASGAIGILPNGYFAQKLTQSPASSPRPSPPAEADRKLLDRG
jgi:hypothetical protein